MGQAVSAVKDAAVKQNQEAERTANDALTALQDLAKLQVQLFKSEVRNDKDPMKVPIAKMIVDDVIIQCSIEQDGAKIAGEVKETYKQFASGETADGIGSVLSMGLKALFGNAAGNSNHTTKYFITVGSLGYPLRVDMLLYTYSFTSDTLIKVTKNVVAIALVVSSVDMKALDEATIGATVQYAYGGATLEVQQKILDKLTAIHAKLVGGGDNTPTGIDSALEVDETKVRKAFHEIMLLKEGILASEKGQ